MATATNLVPHKIFLAGRWVDSPDLLTIENPARPGEPAGLTYQATPEQYEEAVQAAVAAFEVTRKLPAYERAATLRNISAGIRARREELGRLIALEAGKPIRDALVEVDRAILTFRLGRGGGRADRRRADPARPDGQQQGPGRDHPALPGRPGRRDQPLQLPAQPGRPQAGPGDRGRLLDRPQAALQGSPHDADRGGDRRGGRGAGRVGEHPADEPRARRPPGRRRPLQGPHLHREPGRRLGDEGAGRARSGSSSSSAATPAAIVDRTADLDWAVKRITVGAFAYSGQVCISVQRIFVHDDVFDAFMEKFVAAASALRLGDPLDAETDLGPMVDEKAAARTQAWVDEAVAMGGARPPGRHGERDVLRRRRSSSTRRVEAKVCSRGGLRPARRPRPLLRLRRRRPPGERRRASGSRRASSRTTSATRSRPSTSSRSAASSSTTSRPTGSTTCPTAA